MLEALSSNWQWWHWGIVCITGLAGMVLIHLYWDKWALAVETKDWSVVQHIKESLFGGWYITWFVIKLTIQVLLFTLGTITAIQIAWVGELDSVALWRWGLIAGAIYIVGLYLIRWRMMKKSTWFSVDRDDN